MTTPFPFVAGQILTAAQLNDIQNLPISDKTASYVLTATDVYKRTMMNSASATTITVNNSIFSVGDVIQLANKGAGICTVPAGAGVTINTSGSLALAQYGGGYSLCLSASTFTFFSLGGISYGTASGGSSSSITVGGVNYTLLTFTTDGTLTVSKSGLFDVLLVGGGGGGGTRITDASGGGGGAGQLIQQQIYLTVGTYTADVGAGGANRTNGLASQIGTALNGVSATGGGFGAQYNDSNFAGAGGSGGGAYQNAGFAMGLGGNNGGIGVGVPPNYSAGGGGGYGAVGSNAPNATTGGAGGAGYDVSAFIGGSALFKAGGGGGGATTTGGAGGSGVGGAGGGGASGTAAGANTGSGGGGGGVNTTGVGGAGGSGIIYVRFR